MKKSTKIISILLSLCMILAFVPVISFAATYDYYAVYDSSSEKLIFCYGEWDGVSGTVYPENESKVEGTAVFSDFLNGDVPWNAYANSIQSVEIRCELHPTSTAYWFSHFSNLTQVSGMANIKTDYLTAMDHMFESCSSLTSLNLSGFYCNPENNIDNEKFFSSCDVLSTLTLSDYFPIAGTALPYPPSNSSYTGDWIKDGDDNNPYKPSDFEALSGTKSISGTWTWKLNTYVPDDPPAVTGDPYAVYYKDSLTFCVGTANGSTVELSNGNSIYGDAIYSESEFIDGGQPWSDYTKYILEVSFLDTLTPTSMENWFQNCYNLHTISGINLLKGESLTSMEGAFNGCSALTSLDLSWVDSTVLSSVKDIFLNCTNLSTLILPKYFPMENSGLPNPPEEDPHTGKWIKNGDNSATYKSSDLIALGGSSDIVGTWTWEGLGSGSGTGNDNTYAVYNASEKSLSFCVGTLTDYGVERSGGDTVWGDEYYTDFTNTENYHPWENHNNEITAVYFLDEIHPVSTSSWFYSFRNLSHIYNIENLKTDNTTNMGGMFYECMSLTSLDLSGFDTQNVTNIQNMLSEMYFLSSVTFNKSFPISSVSLPIPEDTLPFTGKWVKAGGDGTTYTSEDVQSLSGDDLAGTWVWERAPLNIHDTWAALDLASHSLTFCVGTLVGNETEAWVERDKGGTVSGTLFFRGFLEAPLEDPGEENRYSLWTDHKNIIYTVDFADEISPVYTAEWFYKHHDLTAVYNAANLNMSNVTDMSDMFGECERLATLDVSTWNTANVTDMYRLFDDCRELSYLDVSGWVTDSVTDMSWMFNDCRGLTSLDVSNFNTANVEDMYCMFSGCKNITSLNVSGFNTAKVKDMSGMFEDTDIASLDLSSFSTESVELMGFMFPDELSSLTLGPDFRFKTGYDPDKEDWRTPDLPDASDESPYTGHWVKVDGDGTQYTAEQLMAAYNGSDAMVGRWIWETDGTVPPAVDGDVFAVYDDGTQTLTFCVGTRNDGENFVTRANGEQVSGSYIYSDSDYDFLDGSRPWSKDDDLNDYMTTVVFMDEIYPTSTKKWFNEAFNLTTVTGLENLNTQYLRSMELMFCGCALLTNVDLSTYSAGLIEDLGEAFYDCSSLESLDISSFVVTEDLYAGDMLYGCSALTTLCLPKNFPLNVTGLPAAQEDDQFTGFWVKEGDDTLYTSEEFNNLSGTEAIAGKWSKQTKSVSTQTNLSAATVTVNTDGWTDTSVHPPVTVTVNGTMLTEGTDYSVTYTYNEETHTGTVTVSAIDGSAYTGGSEQSFTYSVPTQTNLSAATVTVNTDGWTDTSTHPPVSVKVNGRSLREGTDYAVSYRYNAETRTGTVTVSAIDGSAYAGSVTRSFTVASADPGTDPETETKLSPLQEFIEIIKQLFKKLIEFFKTIC